MSTFPNTTVATSNVTVATSNGTVATPNVTTTTGIYWNYTITTPQPSYWNGYSWVPYCPTCYPQYVTVEPPLVVDYTYTYIYYCLLVLLVIAIIVCIKLGMNRRNQLQRQAAALRNRARRQTANANASSNTSVNANDDNSCHMGPKLSDAPPAYADVMQPYLNAKQQILDNEAGANVAVDVATLSNPSNNMSNGISTITIETDIPSNATSTADLNNTSNPTNAAAALASRPDTPSTPTTYETNMMDSEKSKDHIV